MVESTAVEGGWLSFSIWQLTGMKVEDHHLGTLKNVILALRLRALNTRVQCHLFCM